MRKKKPLTLMHVFEREFFRQRAAAIGESPRMVGIIGHEQTVIQIPSNESPGYTLLWDEDLPELVRFPNGRLSTTTP